MKKLSTTKKALIGIGLVLVLIIGSASFALNHYASKVERVEIDRSVVTETGKEPAKEDQDVVTIALLGTDFSQNEKYGNLYGASDCTMILGIDKKNNKLKLFSLMRDMYLDLPDGSGKQNLNYTMAYGGPELILKTINTNFNLTVDKFISVSLHTLPEIIDKLGGVEMNITNEELNYINGYIKNIDSENGTNTEKLTSAGTQTLNGTQAAAYCRIRYTSGGDYKRTERHREVLSKIFEKILSMSPTTYPSLLNDLLPMVSTNLDGSEIMELGNKILKIGNTTLEQERFPRDGYCEGQMINGVYYLTFDKETTVNQLHDYIFEDKITW